MQDLPHHYRVSAKATDTGDVVLGSAGLDDLVTAPPAEFGGPGNRWSPETLLIGAVADCFVLTFRAVAQASRLEWASLDCDVEGALDRVERSTQFTGLTLKVRLQVPGSVSVEKAERALHKAEANCLITNSLNCEVTLETDVRHDS